MKPILAASVSVTGAISNFLVQAHPILSTVCITVSVGAGVYAILVSHATLRHRRLQREMDKIDIARNQVELCDGCLTGRIPSVCPIPTELRPVDCPKRTKANDD